MNLKQARLTKQTIASWICLCVYLVCVSGLISWGGGLYAVIEGDHGVSIQGLDQQRVIVLDHSSSGTKLHHHSLLTNIITAFSVEQGQAESDHCLPGGNWKALIDERSNSVPEPPLFYTTFNFIGDDLESLNRTDCGLMVSTREHPVLTPSSNSFQLCKVRLLI